VARARLQHVDDLLQVLGKLLDGVNLVMPLGRQMALLLAKYR